MLRRRRGRDRRRRRRRRARLRRSAHARRLRRRSARRAAPASRPARPTRRSPPPAAASSARVTATRAAIEPSAGGRHARPPRRDAALRHDDVRGQERLRAHHRGRAEDAADDARARGERTRSSCRRPSWARTKCRSSTATAGAPTCDLIVDEMIPAVARERPGRMVRRVLRDRRVHAGRIARDPRGRPRRRAASRASTPTSSRASGGSAVAAEVGARSADHLIFVDEAGAAALAAAGVVATLLPIASFYLKLGRFAPARMLIDARRRGRARDRRQPRRAATRRRCRLR